MADDDKDWVDVPPKKTGGAATAVADDEWEDVPTPATPAKTETQQAKPGFFKRLGQSVGLPTSKEELEAQPKPSFTEAAKMSLGPLIPAAQGAYEWGKRAVKNIGEGGKEELEAARNIKEGGPVLPNIGKAAYGIVHGGVGSIPFVGEPIETAGQDISNKNYTGAAGGLTGVVGQIAAPELTRASVPAVRGGIGNVLVDSMGRPKPLPRLILGNERAAALGEIAKPEIAERQGAQEIRSAKDEMMNDLANRRINRGEEQAKLDTDFEKRLKAQEDARQKELAANERLKTMHGTDLMRRGAEQESIDTASTQKAGTIPKIISPTEGEAVRTGNEGRGATWTNEAVLEEAGKGNREGIRQAILRKLPLPPNVRYVMGDPDTARAVLNPREVTRFTPEGEPIRDKSNPFTEEPTARIPTIARTPKPGIIPKIGENVPGGTPLPFPGPMPESIPAAVAVGEKPQSITERPTAKPAGEAPTLLEPRAPFGIKPLENAKPIMPEAPVEEEAAPAEIKGVTEPVKGKTAAKAKPVPIEKRFTSEEIADAEGMLRQDAEGLQQGGKAGRQFTEDAPWESTTAAGRSAKKGERMGGKWVNLGGGGRDLFPFLRENPKVNPGDIIKALRNKDSAAYRNLIEKAVEFNRRNAPPVDEAYDFLRQLESNPDAEMEGIQQDVGGAEPTFNPAEIEEQAKPKTEKAEGALGLVQALKEARQAPEVAKPIIPQIGKGETGVIPGMEQAVKEQQAGAAKVAGEGLTAEANKPKDISAAAGRMETLSPLFRGTEASPQREIFANRPAPEANAAPAPIQEAIEGTNWKFEGKNNLGLYTIQEPGTNIKLSLFERELNPDFIRRKIAEKEKQFGAPKGKPKPAGEVNF